MWTLWTRLLEWCAESLGAIDGPSDEPPGPRRRRRLLFFGAMAALVAFDVVLPTRGGVRGLLTCAAMFALAIASTRAVLRARARLWRAATLELSDPAQGPGGAADPWFGPMTARTLNELALVVDAARRQQYASALDRIARVDRRMLRDDEARLLDAARAMLSLGLGDALRAAQQAVLALPSGSQEIDALLGRVVVADAWRSPSRLVAIQSAWRVRGEGAGTDALDRLARLMQVRVAPESVEALKPVEARALADEARAIGDDELAAALDARGRTTAYR